MRGRGFTLVELMVACAIFSLLATLLLGLLVPSIHGVQRAASDTDTQQSAVQALDKMFAEAAYTDFRTIAINPDPPALAFLSKEPPRLSQPDLAAAFYHGMGLVVDPDLKWSKFVAMYFESGSQRLLRREFSIPPTAELQMLNLPALPGLLTAATPPPSVLARQVTAFAVAPVGHGRLQVQVTAQSEYRSKKESTTLQTEIAVRNGV